MHYTYIYVDIYIYSADTDWSVLVPRPPLYFFSVEVATGPMGRALHYYSFINNTDLYTTAIVDYITYAPPTVL